MAFVLRTEEVWFPSSCTLIEEPIVCTQYPTLQDLAKVLQAGGIDSSSATIIGGRIYTNVSVAAIETACAGS